MIRSLLKRGLVACCIILVSVCIGLTSNAIRTDGLPLIRKPLHETRAIDVRESSAQKPTITSVSASVVTVKTPSAVKSNIKIQNRSQLAGEIVTVPKTGVIASDPTSKEVGRDSVVDKRQPAKKAEALFTTLADAKSYWDEGTAAFVDARPIEDYNAEHIAGAVNLSYDHLDELYGQVLSKLPKDKIIVTYCSDPECTTAVKLADELVRRGYTKVVILMEGLPGWKEAGYPTITGKDAR